MMNRRLIDLCEGNASSLNLTHTSQTWLLGCPLILAHQRLIGIECQYQECDQMGHALLRNGWCNNEAGLASILEASQPACFAKKAMDGSFIYKDSPGFAVLHG